MSDLFVEKDACLSDCKTYRYLLTRKWETGDEIYGFVGVNPSIANAEVEDRTTMKWRGFVRRWGGRGYVTVNLFAFRATNVKELANTTNPVGPGNDKFIQRLADEVDVIIPCWGHIGKLPPQLRYRVDDVLDILRSFDRPLRCFGTTADGQPKHPLILPYWTKLQDFEPTR